MFIPGNEELQNGAGPTFVKLVTILYQYDCEEQMLQYTLLGLGHTLHMHERTEDTLNVFRYIADIFLPEQMQNRVANY